MGIIANFTRLSDNFNKVDLTTLTSEVAAQNEPELAALNRKQLYEKGEDSEGNKLKKYRRAKYARVKHEMNPLPGLGNPDFYVTGAFQKSIFANVQNRSIVFDAKDRKSIFLVQRDGDKIYGLSSESKIEAWNTIIRPPLVQKINLTIHSK